MYWLNWHYHVKDIAGAPFIAHISTQLNSTQLNSTQLDVELSTRSQREQLSPINERSDPVDSVCRSWRHKQKTWLTWLYAVQLGQLSSVELCRHKHPFKLLDRRGSENDASARPPNLTSPSCDLDIWPTNPRSWPVRAVAPWTACVSVHRNRFISFQNIVFTSLVTDEQTDKRTDRKH